VVASSPIFLVCVLFHCLTAFADSWEPWQDRRVVSSNGQFYVVLKRQGGPKVYGEWGPVEFVIAERKQGSPAVKEANSDITELDIAEYDSEKGGQAYRIKDNAEVSVREGDAILGRGRLKRPPLKIVVSSTGLGFVGFDVYGYNLASSPEGWKHPTALLIVSKTGEVLHRKSLAELFSKDELIGLDEFRTAGGLFWLNHPVPGWVREVRREIVVITTNSEQTGQRHLTRVLDWETGKVAVGPALDSSDAIAKLKQSDDAEKP
jgi:hypothetical protein